MRRVNACACRSCQLGKAFCCSAHRPPSVAVTRRCQCDNLPFRPSRSSRSPSPRRTRSTAPRGATGIGPRTAPRASTFTTAPAVRSARTSSQQELILHRPRYRPSSLRPPRRRSRRRRRRSCHWDQNRRRPCRRSRRSRSRRHPLRRRRRACHRRHRCRLAASRRCT